MSAVLLGQRREVGVVGADVVGRGDRGAAVAAGRTHEEVLLPGGMILARRRGLTFGFLPNGFGEIHA